MIRFDELTHTYTREDGKELISVTTAIKKYIQQGLYDNVPAAVLEKARAKGSAIHERIDALEKGLPFADAENYPEYVAYLDWCKANPRYIACTEEMVTDNELIAGTIDQVEAIKCGEVAIADLKTTAAVNKEYLAWQLSLYAYMWEKMNPASKVVALYCIHLRGEKCEKVIINRLPDEAINALLECIASGSETFDNPLKRIDDDADKLVERYAELAGECADFEAVLKAKQKDMEAILAQLSKMAENEEKDSLRAVRGTFCRATVGEKRIFNKDTFFTAHPELKDFEKDGIKVSVVNNKAKITWNK